MSSSDNNEAKLFVYLCAGFFAGIFGFFYGFKIRQKKKLIENIPTSTVRGMAVGLVEANGKAVPFVKTLTSHFAKAECVFYRYKVEELRSSGKNSHWVTIASYSSTDYFYLEDGTGKVLVDPTGAELVLKVDRQFRSGIGAQGKNELAVGLAELGIDSKGFLGLGKSIRCSEAYIAPRDFVYVMGTACPAVSGNFSEIGSENLCIRKENAPVFCISDKSEKELLASLSGKMFLFLYGGPFLTVVCLFILIKVYFEKFF